MSRSRITFLVQLAGTLVLLGFLLRGFGLRAFGEVLVRIPPWFYLLWLAIITGGLMLYTVRWQVVLLALGRRVGFRQLLGQQFIALFFNSFLPSAIGGDAAKVLLLGRREGFALVAASVLTDRILGLSAIALSGTVLFLMIDVGTTALVMTRRLMIAIAAGIAIAFVAIVLDWLGAVAAWLDRVPRLGRLIGLVETIRMHARALRRHPLVPLAVLGIVVTYFAALGWIYCAYVRLAVGRDVSFLAMVAVLLAIAVLSNIPVSVNGIGLREQLHYLLLGSLGVPKETAVAASLIVLSQQLILSLVGCALWLRAKPALTGAAEAR